MPVTLVVPDFSFGDGLGMIRLPSNFTGGDCCKAPLEFAAMVLNYRGLTVPEALSFDLLEFEPDLWNLLLIFSILLLSAKADPSSLRVTADVS